MSYFTIKKQFFLVYSNKSFEEYKKIDKYMTILEKSGVGKIIDKEYKNGKKSNAGRRGYNLYNMLAMVIYCFSRFKSSLREMENLCIYDLRVKYIMEDKEPNYSEIGIFINRYIVPYQYEIFIMITKAIIDEYNLDISDQYLDGTKIEANANKYKFVWKPIKFHKKLDEKIKTLLHEMEFNLTFKGLIKSYELNDLIKQYIKNKQLDISSIPNGKGKRLTKEQKNYKIAYGYLVKLLEYEEKERICGNRNSYYKTDKDATAMMMKQDYYSKLSHDFHAGYNIQLLVSAGLITMYGVFQDRSDYYTFIPMNDLYHKYYNSYIKNECADSGYGIYVNYKYMREHDICNYVKFQSWSGESSGKNPQLFYTFEDGVLCLNACIGENISFNNVYHQRNKDSKLFKFTGCNMCNYSYICKAKMKEKNRNKGYRIIELNPDYELLKDQAREIYLVLKGLK